MHPDASRGGTLALHLSVLVLPVTFVAACGHPRTPEAVQPVVFHVAPDGDDRWTGRLDAPDPARRDGPLASLEAARDRVRALVASSGHPAGGIAIDLAPGRH